MIISKYYFQFRIKCDAHKQPAEMACQKHCESISNHLNRPKWKHTCFTQTIQPHLWGVTFNISFSLHGIPWHGPRLGCPQTAPHTYRHTAIERPILGCFCMSPTNSTAGQQLPLNFLWNVLEFVGHFYKCSQQATPTHINAPSLNVCNQYNEGFDVKRSSSQIL